MLRRYIAPVAILAVAALAFMSPAAGAETRVFTVYMDGAQDVPPGDPNATGIARFTINTDTNRICYVLTATRVKPPATAAHIHRAPVGVAGPVVVFLSPPSTGRSSGCLTDADADALVANPANFYVNFHNPTYPGGFVRGQLG